MKKIRDEKERTAADNLCKVIAERYPEQFVEWLFGVKSKVKVMKTELSREPIRADSAISLASEAEIFHCEFQTTIKSAVPLPLRMLDYYVGFKRQHPSKRIRQVLIVLIDSGAEIFDHYRDERTFHGYDVVALWQEEAQELMKFTGLLPLATLTNSNSAEKLLSAVTAKLNMIRSKEERRELFRMSQAFAGLRYDKSLVYRIMKEVGMLEESSVVQDWIQHGVRKGVQQGMQVGERKVILRQLERLVGKLSPRARKQVEILSVEQLESLSEDLLSFKTKSDLTNWLKKHLPAH
jgi:predicted transposase YdaD